MATKGSGVWVEINACYHVNAEGQIRSVRNWNKPRILRPAKAKTGYLTVMLGRGVSKYVHELVLTAFRGNRPEGCTASHLNGKRDDNRISNLAWETHTQNCARQIEHGTRNRGERQGHARLTEAQAKTIRAVKDPDWGWYTTMAKIYGVHPNTIRDAHQGRTWRHL